MVRAYRLFQRPKEVIQTLKTTLPSKILKVNCKARDWLVKCPQYITVGQSQQALLKLFLIIWFGMQPIKMLGIRKSKDSECVCSGLLIFFLASGTFLWALFPKLMKQWDPQRWFGSFLPPVSSKVPSACSQSKIAGGCQPLYSSPLWLECLKLLFQKTVEAVLFTCMAHFCMLGFWFFFYTSCNLCSGRWL